MGFETKEKINPRHIQILWPWELPEKFSGTAVVVDVYAASTNIASFIFRGAKKIFLVNEKTADEIKSQRPDGLVIGESRSLPEDFFDFSNQPAEIESLDISGKTIIYVSFNGTRVIEKVFRLGADQVFTASFTNIGAAVSYFSHSKGSITIVPAGEESFKDGKVLEDEICAQALKDLLYQKKVDWDKKIDQAREFVHAHYALGHPKPELFPQSLKIIFSRNAFPVVPVCQREKEGVIRVQNQHLPFSYYRLPSSSL